MVSSESVSLSTSRSSSSSSSSVGIAPACRRGSWWGFTGKSFTNPLMLPTKEFLSSLNRSSVVYGWAPILMKFIIHLWSTRLNHDGYVSLLLLRLACSDLQFGKAHPTTSILDFCCGPWFLCLPSNSPTARHQQQILQMGELDYSYAMILGSKRMKNRYLRPCDSLISRNCFFAGATSELKFSFSLRSPWSPLLSRPALIRRYHGLLWPLALFLPRHLWLLWVPCQVYHLWQSIQYPALWSGLLELAPVSCSLREF